MLLLPKPSLGASGPLLGVQVCQELLIWAISSLGSWICVTQCWGVIFFFYRHQQSHTNEPLQRKLYISRQNSAVSIMWCWLVKGKFKGGKWGSATEEVIY